MRLRPFEKGEWDAFNGASRFKDGSEPLIYWGEEVFVIVDGHDGGMVTIYFMRGDDVEQPQDEIEFRSHQGSKAQAIEVGELIAGFLHNLEYEPNAGPPRAAEPEHDGQPDEAQEWHDFDPDC